MNRRTSIKLNEKHDYANTYIESLALLIIGTIIEQHNSSAVLVENKNYCH